MSEEPVWAEVLDTIYRKNIIWSPVADFDDEHPVVSAVELDAETVQENLAMLSQSGLVGRVHVGIQAEFQDRVWRVSLEYRMRRGDRALMSD